MTSATFRDPLGSLRLEGDQAVRTIHPEARAVVLDFLASSLRLRLEERGSLIETTVQDSAEGLRLLHPRIGVPVFPWEWTPSQWVAAANLTLGLCQEALADGWVLKDATPLNILFIDARPVMVDVLSFQRFGDSPIWLAYAQYVRTFLLPLLLHTHLHWPLADTMLRRDGYEPGEVYQALSWRQRLSPGVFWPVTVPALLESGKGLGEKAGKTAGRTLDPEAARYVLQRTFSNLQRRTRRALPRSTSSNWSRYSTTSTHYTSDQAAAKRSWVEEVLRSIGPGTVLDVGANTGEYSQLAAGLGLQVVALERDAASAERIARMSQAQNLPILTIHADLARPTPAVGWDNAEYPSLLARLEGKFDAVLLLAVVHHLILQEQIPLCKIMALCARLTRAYLVLEWVPVSDPMYQSLMRGRDELYGSLTEEDFLRACQGRFTVVRRHELANGRVLFLLTKHRNDDAPC